MTEHLCCFKAYDIRGRIPDLLNNDIARPIGRTYGQFLRPSSVIVGHDVRLSSLELAQALSSGLTESGADVLDIGMCGTEEVYFQTFHRGFDGGIMVTASHNPIDYNGMKLVRKGSRPISGDTGLKEIASLTELGIFEVVSSHGSLAYDPDKSEYISHLLDG